jgi:hypothetical protein
VKNFVYFKETNKMDWEDSDSDDDIIPDTPPMGVIDEWLEEWNEDVAVVEQLFRRMDEGLLILLDREDVEFFDVDEE